MKVQIVKTYVMSDGSETLDYMSETDPSLGFHTCDEESRSRSKII